MIILEKLIEKSGYSLPTSNPAQFVYIDEKAYEGKDTLSTLFFVKEPSQNVFMTRLVTTVQEVSTCNWLYTITPVSDDLQLDNYILLRLLSIKVDEVMDNLKNMQSFSYDIFRQVDEKCNFNLSQMMSNFEKEMKDECARLRNMLHYSTTGENFLDYVYNKLVEDNGYIRDFTYKLTNNYTSPLNELISDYLQVDNLRSMSDSEKIIRRLTSIVKRRDFRSL